MANLHSSFASTQDLSQSQHVMMVVSHARNPMTVAAILVYQEAYSSKKMMKRQASAPNATHHVPNAAEVEVPSAPSAMTNSSFSEKTPVLLLEAALPATPTATDVLNPTTREDVWTAQTLNSSSLEKKVKYTGGASLDSSRLLSSLVYFLDF